MFFFSFSAIVFFVVFIMYFYLFEKIWLSRGQQFHNSRAPLSYESVHFLAPLFHECPIGFNFLDGFTQGVQGASGNEDIIVDEVQFVEIFNWAGSLILRAS